MKNEKKMWFQVLCINIDCQRLFAHIDIKNKENAFEVRSCEQFYKNKKIKSHGKLSVCEICIHKHRQWPLKPAHRSIYCVSGVAHQHHNFTATYGMARHANQNISGSFKTSNVSINRFRMNWMETSQCKLTFCNANNALNCKWNGFFSQRNMNEVE